LVLLIGESVGWQELILIGALALIIFGPRKLPQMGRTIGKYMAEFRRATQEFKATWESEVSTIAKDFKDELKDSENDMRMLALLETPKPVENSIGRNQSAPEENGNSSKEGQRGEHKGEQMELPTIREVEPTQFKEAEEPAPAEIAAETSAETAKESKKDWL
jgi:Tat protein translocase TatB subunit